MSKTPPPVRPLEEWSEEEIAALEARTGCPVERHARGAAVSTGDLSLPRIEAVLDFSEDLDEELDVREGLVPCTSRTAKGDCLQQQLGRTLLEDVVRSRLCQRCLIRWHYKMFRGRLRELLSSKRDVARVGDIFAKTG
jgi:hypothetical protein